MKKASIVFALVFVCAFICLVPAVADEAMRPTIIMDSYTVSGNLAAGENIVLEYTLRNASPAASVNNILFKIEDSAKIFYPSQGKSNQRYVSYIDVWGTHKGQIELSVNKNAPDGVHYLNFNISYQGSADAGMVFTSTGYIALEVRGSVFLLVELGVPAQCVAGRQTYISVRYANNGDNELRGAKVLFEGGALGGSGEIPIGVVRPGVSGVAEGYIVLQEAGEQELTFYLSYEGEDGELIRSDPYIVMTNAMEGASLGTQEVTVLDPEPGLSEFVRDNAVWLIAAAGVVCVAALIFGFVKKKRR